MEHKIVKNVSQEQVIVLWDGQQVSFEPGQSKVFPVDLAIAISSESDSLQIVDTELVEKIVIEEKKPEVFEEPKEEPEEEPVKKTRKKKQ